MPQPHRLAQSPAPPPLVAVALALLLGGCGAFSAIADYPIPESAAVDAADWPRLVDGPTHVARPPAGPDPALGGGVASTLTADARAMAARAEALGGPVVPAEALRAEARAARAGR